MTPSLLTMDATSKDGRPAHARDVEKLLAESWTRDPSRRDRQALGNHKPPICPRCKVKTRLTTGREVLPLRADAADKRHWLCDGCGAYVGCHAGTAVALGIPADRQTRLARQRVHVVVDDIWQSASEIYDFSTRNEMKNKALSEFAVSRARSRVYRWLARSLDLPEAKTHVAMFDMGTCQRAMAALNGAIYSEIREWARSVEAGELLSSVKSNMSPAADAVGMTIGVTGPRYPNTEDFYRDVATAWLRLARPLDLVLKLGSAFDVGFAEAAAGLEIPYSVVVNPLQKPRSNAERIQATLVGATDLHVVHDETNRDAWIAVRKTLLPRIRGLAVVMDGPPDPLTRIAHDDGKTMFDIRSDLVLDGYWTDEITNTSDRL